MQTENRERGWTTVKGAAAFTGMSVAKLYQLMSAGELAYAKLGKSRRIAWSALDDLMQRHTVRGGNGEATGSHTERSQRPHAPCSGQRSPERSDESLRRIDI